MLRVCAYRVYRIIGKRSLLGRQYSVIDLTIGLHNRKAASNLDSDISLLLRAYETFRTQLRPGHWRTGEVAVALAALGASLGG